MAFAYIGEAILFNKGNTSEYLVFLGADQLGNGSWRVNLSRERVMLHQCIAVPMHLDVSIGQEVRMPQYGIYWDQKRGVPTIGGVTLYTISAIRFLSLACDCIELAYLFPKQP